jgi:hypothetical protein
VGASGEQGEEGRAEGRTGKPTEPAPANGNELVAAIDASLAADPSVAKAVAKLAAGIEKKCTDAQIGELFDCNAAATRTQLAICVRLSAEQAACEAIEDADGIDLDCPVLPVAGQIFRRRPPADRMPRCAPSGAGGPEPCRGDPCRSSS